MRRVQKLIPHFFVNFFKHLPLAVLANLSNGFPARGITVIGVTGTDGKTTTVNMIYKILKDAGEPVSMVSTINAVIGGKSYDTGFHVTSPNPFMVQKFLRQAKKNKDRYFILEVTSHALDQFRTFGVHFNIGVVTNVTHEHLDYHKTFNRYLRSKAKLIKNADIAVLNKDDENFSDLSRIVKKEEKVISFGLSDKADINIKKFPLNLKIPGDYNIFNALAAIAVTKQLGIDIKIIKKSLESFVGLPGRMEEVSNNKGVKVFIDFAHTPNALGAALKTLRDNFPKSRLISVFGAAAERDTSKRPIMGKVVSRHSDVIFLTDEDPRFEDSLKIINEIASGIPNGFKLNHNLFKEPNRLKAIKKAIHQAKKGDIVGIFGKGHEKSMNYRGKERPWSDLVAARKAFS